MILRNNSSSRLLRWFAAFLWMAVIWIAGSNDFGAFNTFSISTWFINLIFPGWPASHLHEMHIIHAMIRKAAHIIEYAILFILYYRAFEGNIADRKKEKNRILCGILSAILWACVDEYHQSFMPNRTGSLWDVGVDTIGIIIAWQVVIRQNKLRL